jgi:hypothetical protein
MRYQKSKSSRVVGIRLSNDDYRRIEQTLDKPTSRFMTVGEYCKEVIERHVHRHDTRKYRTTPRGKGGSVIQVQWM